MEWNTTQKLEIKLDTYNKCSAFIDADCPLGQLFDFTCSLRAFVFDKMQEAKKISEELEKKVQEAPKAPKEDNGHS